MGRKAKTPVVEGMVKIDGVDFVLISADEYLQLGGEEWRLTGLPPRRGSAVAKRVRNARKHAGLTQAALAERLGKSQTLVSQAESGVARVNERYLRAVLKACGLRSSWGAARGNSGQAAPLAPEDIAGLDPETFEVVARGSKRDLELKQKYVWWSNG